jgi:hypothetical protein
VRLLFQGFESTGAARQYARPSADVSAGGWTASAGSDLYAMVDEVTADDLAYITSASTPSFDTAVLSLSAMSPPIAGTITMRVRGRFLSPPA